MVAETGMRGGLPGLSHELAHGFPSCRLANCKRETHTISKAHAAAEPSTGSVAKLLADEEAIMIPRVSSSGTRRECRVT